jgi:hypothetical protein
VTGGLRFAPTSGYFLATLRVATVGYGEPDELQQRILKAESPLEFLDEVYERASPNLQKPL